MAKDAVNVLLGKPMNDRSQQRRQLLGLQATRGLAALMVVCFHATMTLGKPEYLSYRPLGNFFAFGHAGVDFFFVLSGFIIGYVHGADLGRPDRLGRYGRRRFTRIYPIYWLITAGVAAFALFAGDAGMLTTATLLESLTLISFGSFPLVPPAWTLEHEVLFYGAFGLAIWHRGMAKFLVALCLLLVAAGGCFPTSPWPLLYLGSPYHLQFLMGIAAALVIAHHDVRHPLLIAAAGASLFAMTAVLDVAGRIPEEPVSVSLYGIGSVLAIIGIAAAERSGVISCGRAAETFGAMSFSLYLTNLYAVGLTTRICARLGLLGAVPDWLIMSWQVVAALIVALGVHLLLEKPLMRLFR